MAPTSQFGFRKNYQPGYYNMRFKPSQGSDGNYISTAAPYHGPDGAEATKTQRDPTKFSYVTNLINTDYWEWRMRAGDYLYQIGSRLHRSNDMWTRSLVAYAGFSFMMMPNAALWKLHFLATTLVTATRIRDKGGEPTVDEVYVLDQLFSNEKLRALFTPETYHVMDFDQEWEQGLDNPLFPEYRQKVARFFNTDCNTTTGRFKIGDVESGATMTLHFKTMPYSNNKFNFTEPFLVYDMWAEVSHNGEYFTESIIKAEDTLRSKRIFVLWH